MKNIYLILNILVLFYTPIYSYANQNILKGQVVSQKDGSPIQGVTVKSKNGKIETYTDSKGYFTLHSKESVLSLEISHMQYEEKSIVFNFSSNDNLIIKLHEKENRIDEIVISTGYQEFSKSNSTGSFEKIGTELLNSVVSIDLLSKLNNTSTGTYINPRIEHINTIGRPIKKEFSIHGLSTLREDAGSSNAPLIILDNFPYEGDINSINPNEIESITLLKDAAASSIWGAKAGNGVIVITSKRAAFNQKIKINYSTNYLIRNKPDLFKHEIIESKDLIAVERELFDKGFYNVSENSPSKPVLPPAVELLILHRDGKISTEELNKNIRKYEQQDVRNDIDKYLYRNSLLQQHNLDLQGGGANYNFILGLGYDKSNAAMRGFANDRIALRLNNVIKLSPKMQIQFGVRKIGTKDNGPTSSLVYSDLGYTMPYVSLVDDLGNPMAIPYQYSNKFLDAVEKEGVLLDWRFNPIEEIQNQGRKIKSDEIVLQTSSKYDVFDWLNIQLRYQWNKQSGINDMHYDINSYYTRNLINRGTSIQSGKPIYNFPYGDILDHNITERISESARLQTEVNKTWKHFKFSTMLGMDIQNSITTESGDIKFGYNPDLMNFANNLDYNKTYPVYASLGSPERIPFNMKEIVKYTQRFVSVFSNSNFTVLEKYIVTASARKDASNLFGVEINNKWTPLWSIGGAWLLHKENFINMAENDFLKLRGSYGYSGNVNSRMSAKTVFTYSSSNVAGVDYPSGGVQYPPNPNLRWEKVANLNLGLDVSLFGSKINTSLDIYRKRTKDLIGQVVLDPTTGYGTVDMNVGGTKSLGMDLNLGYKQNIKSVKWQSNFLFSYNNNWVIESNTKYSSPTLLVRTGLLRNTIKDMMVYPALSYKWAGLDPEDGTPLGYLNGEISKQYNRILSGETKLEDLVLHGSARPIIFGAFRNTFTVRDFTFSVNLSYRMNFFFRRQGLDYLKLFYNGDGHKDYYERWKAPGDEKYTQVPSLQYPLSSSNTFYQYADILMQKGDHIRIDNIRVNYKLKLNKAQCGLFIQANNLGILWRANELKLDPDVDGGIPNPRNYAMGINLNL